MKHEALFNRVKVPVIGEINTFDHTFGFIGSCFSTHMFDRFRRVGLPAWISPYGTTYNPKSIEKQLFASIELNEKFNSYDHNESHFYWETSHQLLYSSVLDLEEKVGGLRKNSQIHLQNMGTLFITLGTAWVYEWEDTGLVVANCHKVPQSHFKKRLLEIDEIVDSLNRIIRELNRFNPFLQIVLTVSPVRHVREGLVENNWSKARLIESCQSICQPILGPKYFPSYELIMDELRDYRFFESDGVHPNVLAVDFVWERLKESLFHPSLYPIFKEVLAVRQREGHRVINDNGLGIENHVKTIESLKEDLRLRHQVHW